MDGLFAQSYQNKVKKNAPLAYRARPTTLSEFAGQEHLLADGKMLRRIIDSGHLSSMLFWGPPGCGKSTLAKIATSAAEAEFIQLNAVTSNVSDVRKVIETASNTLSMNNIRTVLFIDEIHRFNKSQQDSLLPSVESGEIILIGATTFNPYFYVIPALISRLLLFEFKPLSEFHLLNLVNIAFKKFYDTVPSFEDGAFTLLTDCCGKDPRKILNLCEIACETGIVTSPYIFRIEHIHILAEKATVSYDKDEQHYDIISAFIKSIRASEPDAALHYLARMLEGGEDIRFIARRIVISASEDIGNANPMALVVAESAFSAVEKIGMPESALILAQAVTYLASSPKSNASYKGISAALSDVKTGYQYPIPEYLKDASYSSAKKTGRGVDYKYPHDFPGHAIHNNDPSYQPYGDRQYYFPTAVGAEKKLKDYLEWKKTGKTHDEREKNSKN